MLTVESLKEYGADVKKGIARCAGNEALYLRLVGMCIQELSSGALEDALQSGDLERAFDVAHKLKGGVNNLALTPVSVPVCKLTELLRNQTPGDYESLTADLKRETAVLAALSD